MIKRDEIYKDKEGNDVRIICIDAPGDFPVIVLAGKDVRTYTKSGNYCLYERGHHFDLILPEDYSTYKKDEKVMVRNHDSDKWCRSYFSHAENGLALCFYDGGTKWSSSGDVCEWNQCRRPTAEELGEMK